MTTNSTTWMMDGTIRAVTSRKQRASRLSPEERRHQLIDCAVRVFARRGLGRASHAEVAKEAGVAVPTVFSYFKNRDELVDAVLQEVERYYEDMADQYHRDNLPAQRVLVDHGLAFAASVDSHRDHARVLLDWSTAIRDRVWPLYLEFYDRMVRTFENTIRRGQEEGGLASDLDAENAALMLVGSAFMVVQMKFTGRPPDLVYRYLVALLRGAIGPEAVQAALSLC
jgi:TetR/AcrR family transcriptional regulator, hemagglutinin/protease regulatory protein